MVKFVYYLAAIGSPNLQAKKDILQHNLIYIYNKLNENFDIVINCYEKGCTIADILDKNECPFIDNIFFYCRTGMLVELWNTNPFHKKIKNHDYIFFILDDVEIKSLDIKEFIDLKNKYNIEFLSPRVEKSTYDYMQYPVKNKLSITNRLEIFCLLLTYKDFMKYLSINDVNNPYIWGVDFMMAHFNIKTAICYKFTIIHKLPGGSYLKKAEESMNKYLKKHGYNNLKEIIDKYPEDIKENIYI
uniref:Glycosyltransferase n=1 Tax=viral metagenome TaxID=1070528 RepID=A0A6C0LF05_9ZZZZ